MASSAHPFSVENFSLGGSSSTVHSSTSPTHGPVVVVSTTSTTTISSTTTLSGPLPATPHSGAGIPTPSPFPGSNASPAPSVKQEDPNPVPGAQDLPTSIPQIGSPFPTPVGDLTTTPAGETPTLLVPPSNPGSQSSEFAGMVVSTILSASTGSLGVVHTFTEVTTVASYKAVSTGKTTSQNSGDMRPVNSDTSSPNVTAIVMAVVGSLAACIILFLAFYWYRIRRQRNNRYSTDTWTTKLIDKLPSLDKPFEWATRGHSHERLTSQSSGTFVNRFTIGSFGNSQERITLAPFYGQVDLGTPAGKTNLPVSPHVRITMPDRENDDLEGGARPRNREGNVVGDRPPTYYTNTTGLATIATSLPLYSVYDPSPISERSEPPDTPTTATSTKPSVAPPWGRRNPPRSNNRLPRTLTPIGEKF